MRKHCFPAILQWDTNVTVSPLKQGTGNLIDHQSFSLVRSYFKEVFSPSNLSSLIPPKFKFSKNQNVLEPDPKTFRIHKT